MTTHAQKSTSQPLTWEQAEASLRERDHDPKYRESPVLDVYGRLSRDPETGDTEQVDRQLLDCLRDLERRNARLGRVLRDDGVSAWKLTAKRPGWNTLVERLERRECAGVIAWHTDRLMRQPRDLERLISFGESGMLIASCHGDYDLSSADDRFTLRVLTAAAAKDSDNTSRRQRRKAEAMRESGKRSNTQRAFGEPGSARANAKRQATAEQVEAERAAIAWAVRSHLDGVSVRGIAREWNARGLRTVRGLEWDDRYVSQVLTSARIAGLIEHNGVVVGRMADFEPIVSVDDYNAIIAAFTSRKRGRVSTDPYLMSGSLLFCAECSRPMTGRAGIQRGVSTRRYACRDRNGGCGKTVIVSAPVDAFIREQVIEILSDPRHAKRIGQKSAELSKVEAALEGAEALKLELSKRLGEGKITLDQWEATLSTLEPRITALKSEAEALRESGAGAAGHAKSKEQIAAEWEQSTVAGRRVMVRRAFAHGVLVHRAHGNQHTGVASRLSANRPQA